MSSSSPPDQATIMKDILDALKTLQMNQVQLASSVDAISGRSNVLAGMKDVRDVASPPAPLATLPKKPEPSDESDHPVPESPSLPATHIDTDHSPTQVSAHTRTPSTGTSRIILT